jgi:hypothetical protein
MPLSEAEAGVNVHRFDPLQDPRWSAFVARHPRASVFHTRGWLEALHRTYGYQPIAFTTSAPFEELRAAVVFCDIQSWLTGSRLVSLPFSDHCDALVDDDDQIAAFCSYLRSECSTSLWRYIELRPSGQGMRDGLGFEIADRFVLHLLDLRPELHELFRQLHKNSTQRKIVRARREGLVYQEGCDTEMLRAFYRLVVLTRRRHGLPPQPFEWFQQLATCLGDAMKIRLASYREQPVAGIVTLRHGRTLTYKYGASDAAWHRLGGMHFLFWKAIEEAHADGCVTLDFGRTDIDNTGLTTFKKRWGSTGAPLCYWRSQGSAPARTPARDWITRCGARTAGRVPERLRVAAGRVLYKHLG